ncbi:MAG TPA: hypothetical protein VLJ62_19275 [Burkholderiaceae bacterium]|nr:hypothetical protein [Burkholderiaceae bacterium]
MIAPDAGPRPVPPLPEALQAPVGQVVARLLAQVDEAAGLSLDLLREQAYPGGVLKAQFPTIGAGLHDPLKTTLDTELHEIAAAANVSAEALDGMVAERRRELATQGAAAQADAARQGQLAADDVAAQGQQTSNAIEGAAAQAEEQTLQRQEAASGGNDPAVVNRRRDLTVNWIREHVTTQITHYQQAGEGRTADLNRVRSAQGNAYRALVQREQFQVLTPQPPSRLTREVSDRTREARLADLVNAMRIWGDDSVVTLDSSMAPMLAETASLTRSHRGEIESAGSTAIEAARVWAEERVMQGQSWWARFVARIQRWITQAGQLQEQWRVRRTRENRDAVTIDLLAINAARERMAAGVTREQLAADQTLSQADRAIMLQYFDAGPDTHPLDFAARRLRDNVALGLSGRAAEVFETELLAMPVGHGDHDTADKLNEVVRAQSGGFDAAHIAQEVHGAMDQIGTDEQRIFDNLRGLNKLRGAVVRKMYMAIFGDDLDEELDSEMSGDELDQAIAELEGQQSRADAIALHDAVDGVGTNEAAIMRTLRNKTPAEIDAIRAEYRSLFGEPLREALADDLDEGNEIDQADALLRGDTATADAIALDDAMRGGITGWGTDEAEIERVQTQVRSEVLARAQAGHWTAAQMEAEVRRRLGAIEASFEKRYKKVEQYNAPGLQGGTVLARAFASELSGAELDLANALQRNDLVAADAARLEVERRGVYSSDEKITQVLRSQFERALQARRLDEGPARQRAIDERIAALREQRNPVLSEERISRERMQLERQTEAALEHGAQQDSKLSMAALRQTYEGRYDRISLAYDIERMTSGSDRLAARHLLQQGGHLEPLQEEEFATLGDGTDEDALRRVLSRATKAEIDQMRTRWEASHRGRSFDDMLRGELSGRDESDIMDMVDHGAPESALEQIQQENRRVRRELTELTGGVGRGVSGNEEAWMHHQVHRLNELRAPLQRTDWPDTDEGRRAREALAADVNFRVERVQQAVEDHRRRLDSFTDMATQVIGMAVGITVAVVLGAVSGGTLGVATIAIMASLMATASTMVTKRLILGGAYGDEAVMTDLAVGVVDALASAATAGMGSKLLRPMRGLVARTKIGNVAGWIGRSGVAQRATRAPGVLGRLAGKVVPSRSGVERAVAGFLAEGAEDAISAVPSTFAQLALTDQTWRGDPLMNFLEGGGMAMLQSVAMGRMMAAGMHVGGHVFNAGRGHLRMGSDTGRLLEANRLIQDGLHAHLQDNPGASLVDFLHHPDGRKLRAEIDRRGLLPTLESLTRSASAPHADANAPLHADGDAAVPGPTERRTAQLASGLPPTLRDTTRVTPDPTLSGRSVRVEPVRIGKRIVGVELRAGPDATPLDIALHGATVHAMQRYRGVLGNVRRALEDAAALITRSGLTVGSRGWEARLELGKLSAVVTSRMNELAGPAMPAELQLRLLSDAHGLQAQIDQHAAVLRSATLRGEPGRGHVAAEDTTVDWRTAPRHDEAGRLTALGLDELQQGMEQLQALPRPRTPGDIDTRRGLLAAMAELSRLPPDTVRRLVSLDDAQRVEIEQQLLSLRHAGPSEAGRASVEDVAAALRSLTGLDDTALAQLARRPETVPELNVLLGRDHGTSAAEPASPTAPHVADAPAGQQPGVRSPSLQSQRARHAERVLRGGGEESLALAAVDPAWTARLTLAAHLTAADADFEAFLASPVCSQLLSRALPLSSGEQARLQIMFARARADAAALAAHGRQHGMPEAVVESFFALWARHPQADLSQLMNAMHDWALSASGPGGRVREFPASMLDEESRLLLDPFDRSLSNTALPSHTSARRTPEGGVAVTVEAPVLPGSQSRRPRGGQTKAPDLNRVVRDALNAERFFATSGLDPRSWQVMHLVGPSSGIEAAAGMLLGPTSINIGLQTRFMFRGGKVEFEGVEVFINELAVKAAHEGGSVTVRSTVESWPPSQLDPRYVTPEIRFFKSVDYEIRIAKADGTEQMIRVRIEAGRPPATTASIEIVGPAIDL